MTDYHTWCRDCLLDRLNWYLYKELFNRQAQEWARKTTEAQDLPLKVTDPATLQKVVVLFNGR